MEGQGLARVDALRRLAAAGTLVALCLACQSAEARPALRVDGQVLSAGQTDLLAGGKLPVSLQSRGGRRRIRVQVILVQSTGRPVALAGARTIALSRRGTRSLALPISDAGRAALEGCAGTRIVVRLSDRRARRTRRLSRPLRLDPPRCGRFFGSSAFWNAPLAANAPVDPNSAAITQSLVRSVQAGDRDGTPPSINTTAYTPPVYTVGPGQLRVPVALDQPSDAALSGAFASVPLPAGATPAAGVDHELVVWQPATDTLWEFWHLRKESDGWHADWGGRLDSVSSGPGNFADPHPKWGAAATGLPLVGGLLTPRELGSGRIDHALAIAAPSTRKSEYALPAQRTDGESDDPNSVPEGARFRLDPSLNVDALGLAPPIAAMARAAQRYGIVVRDRSATVSFFAQNADSLSSNPYPDIFGGRPPSELLRTFPWQHLQLMKMDLQRMPDQGGGGPLPCLLGRCP